MTIFGWDLLDVFRPAAERGLPRRAAGWPALRAAFLKTHPRCAACGGTEQVTPHHIVPFHVDRTLELDVRNLLPMCEAHQCHLRIAHLGDWKSYNAHVVEDAAFWLDRILRRPRPVVPAQPAERSFDGRQ